MSDGLNSQLQADIYYRRQELARVLRKPCLVIVDSGSVVEMSFGNAYRYRQDSDFLYLTGFPESGACFVMMVHQDYDFPENPNLMSTRMFVQENDPIEEIWTGKRVGVERICQDYMIDSGFSIKALAEHLEEWILSYRNTMIYHLSNDRNSASSKLIGNLLIRNILNSDNYSSSLEPLHQIRCRKTPYEIELLRQACKISGLAHKQLIKSANSRLTEAQLDGLFTGSVIMSGCPRLAYPNIVGSGINATTLHYEQNNKQLLDGELVLIDAGGEYQGYAADITRTWPINGVFSQEQRDIYQLVLDVQKTCISLIKPGVNFLLIQQVSEELITLGLMKLGLLVGNFEELMERKACKSFYMHKIGHWLGMDVHDCPQFEAFDSENSFLSGYVLTIEPGIYISEVIEATEFIPASVLVRYRGIGIRIEDDILVLDNGYEILSDNAPKEIDELELLIGCEPL